MSIERKIGFESEKNSNEEFLCNIFHGIQDSILIIDRKGKINSFNKKILSLLGVDTDHMADVRLHDISAPDMPEKVAEKHIDNAFEGADQFFTWQLVKPEDSSVIDVEIYLSKISRKDEEVLLASIRDITDKKLIEDNLRSSEYRYRQLVEHSPDGIVIHVKGVVKYVNQAAAAILGGSEPEDILGREVMSFFDKNSSAAIEEKLRELYEDKKPIPLTEGEMVQIDGGKVYVDFAALPFDLDGKTAVQVVIRDITQKKKQDEYIRYLALHDKLTGLPNRELLADRVNKAIKRRKRDKHKNALIYFDLDGFKPVNDTLGHAAGDKALQEIAGRLERSVRGSDTAARMGGDEFVILLEDVKDIDEIKLVTKRVHDSVNELLEINGQTFHVGASMGIAVYPDDSANHAELITMADKAMYYVKETGKNRFEFYHNIPK